MKIKHFLRRKDFLCYNEGMTTLESTLTMVKTLSDADLVKLEKSIWKLRRERFEKVFPKLTVEELQEQLKESMREVEEGKYEDADVMLAKLRKKYSL